MPCASLCPPRLRSSSSETGGNEASSSSEHKSFCSCQRLPSSLVLRSALLLLHSCLLSSTEHVSQSFLNTFLAEIVSLGVSKHTHPRVLTPAGKRVERETLRWLGLGLAPRPKAQLTLFCKVDFRRCRFSHQSKELNAKAVPFCCGKDSAYDRIAPVTRDVHGINNLNPGRTSEE